MRLDGYMRVSRVGGREGEGYISLKQQREAIKAYAAELGGEIVAWHEDEDRTGGNIDRPGFQALLNRLRDGETDGLVVMRVDRFARSVADGAPLVRQLRERGQIFASCVERMDTATDFGNYMLNQRLSDAELFLDQSKSSWKSIKAQANGRGVHIGPTPIGYVKREKSQPLIPHGFYGPAITELFKRAAKGTDDDAGLARWFSQRAPGEDRSVYSGSEIRRWLGNRIYLGEVKHGDLVTLNAHPRLTSPKTWERAQRQPGPQRAPHRKFLLSGLLRCANCRYSMGGFSYGGSGQTPVYRCSHAKKGGCSESSVITAANLDKFMRQLAVEHVRGLELEAASDRLDLADLDEAFEEAERELQAFAADLAARRRLGEAGWQGALTARAEDRDAKRIARAKGYAASRLAGVARLDVEDLGHDDLRDLLHGLVRTVFIRRQPRGATVEDRSLVIWSDDTREIEVPGPHRSGPFEPIRW